LSIGGEKVLKKISNVMTSKQRKKINIKSGDVVLVLSGKDKGKKGKVLAVDRVNSKLIVEGVSVATIHKKARRNGETSGIFKKEIPFYACKAMVVCPKCNLPSRLGRKILENGKHSRFCKKCGETIDD
jgi:large subunit ribosomal protein L24